jgi:preprotein translocase subunit SecD
VTPPRRRGCTSVRALVALAAIIVIMLISVLGNETLSPGKWHQQFKVGLGLDLSSGTNVVLTAETRDGSPPASGEMQQARTVLLSRVNGTGNSGPRCSSRAAKRSTSPCPVRPPITSSTC